MITLKTVKDLLQLQKDFLTKGIVTELKGNGDATVTAKRI